MASFLPNWQPWVAVFPAAIGGFVRPVFRLAARRASSAVRLHILQCVGRNLRIRLDKRPFACYPILAFERKAPIAEWSSLVARRAHNPKVVWFKSRLRNQKESTPCGCFFLVKEGLYKRSSGYETDERSSLGNEVKNTPVWCFLRVSCPKRGARGGLCRRN